MAFYIDRIIIHNRAPFEHLDLSLKKDGVVLLNAYSGGGKTTILSHIVDSLIELARPTFGNEFEDRANKYYRVSSSLFNLDLSKPSFVYIRYVYEDNDGHNKTIDYVDIRNKCSEKEYNDAVGLADKIPFNALFKELDKAQCVKRFSSNLNGGKDIEKLFGSNILTYFPAYRFEYPGYLSDSYSNSISYEKEMRFSGFLPNRIEVITGLKDLTNWMMDVLVDWQVNKSTETSKGPNGEEVVRDKTTEKENIWDVLNYIINLSINHNEDDRLRLGIGKRNNPSERICVMCDGLNGEYHTKYPSIFNLSMGETAVITLFGEILRQADRIGFTRDVPGIVLIDEIDSHLHIEIQKEVLPRLIEIFPNVQFIMTSHSPFVGMGLSEIVGDRLSLVVLNKKTTTMSSPIKNPLYDEVYQMFIAENDNFKTQCEKLLNEKNPKMLLVEDKYDQIYKIAWLTLKGISFDEKNIESQFLNNAPFKIVNGLSASGVAGCMNVTNPSLFSGRTIVGLFDFDKEGSERFYNLSTGFDSKDRIYGDIKTGLYKKKNTSNDVKMYAVLLPIPDRLLPLISRSKDENLWKGNGVFANYVEVETLLQEDFLKNSSSFELENICGHDYYVAKDKKKDSLWKELCDQPKEVFSDFIPLFERIYGLFDLGSFGI